MLELWRMHLSEKSGRTPFQIPSSGISHSLSNLNPNSGSSSRAWKRLFSTPASNQSSSVVVIPLPHQRARSLAAALSSSTLQPRQQAQTACWSFIVISRRHKQGAPSSSVEQKGMKNLLSSTSPLASGQRQETEFASTPFPSPSVAMRLWRPAAQRNLRNQWSKLLSYRQQWISASSDGRSHATSVVNAHLSHRYLPNMDLGVLKGMVGIQQRACQKLAQQQEHYQHKLLSSYKNMVAAVVLMVNVTRSMRCFLKGSSSSPIVQFSDEPDDSNDTGDGGGIPVFSSLSISLFENLAKELTQMFCLELSLKRLLVLLLLLISCDEDSRMQVNGLSWEEELYPGEFDDLNMSDLLYSTERCQPVLPRINGQASRNPILEQASHLPDRDILQVYLTAWLVEANIDIYRVDQIFALVGEEMNVNLS